ncbi:unnamed protein product [Dracunculus medinensis]|uniref:Nup54 domain-containing protein n=1 Tax=Dracunculus medinensis TaxID=318479 RepID=A0A0N4U2E2_DRAME|nr:unnamed protein product [Dracunculus medinensis]
MGICHFPLWYCVGEISAARTLFGPTTPAATTTTTSLLSSTAATSFKPSGLFSAPVIQPTVSQAAPTYMPTLQDIIQNSDALIRCSTSPELYGDERDSLIAKFNQLQAACGVGKGYYKTDLPPLEFKVDGPFYLYKAVVYNRNSDYKESDGMVVLTLSVPYEQITDGVRQKLVDALNVILGNNINLRAHLEHVRTLPGNNTEVLFYVTEKGKVRISSMELYNYLKQPAQEAELKNQLYVSSIVPRARIEGTALQNYLQNPPSGFDAQIWQQAINDNPDPEKLIPYVIRGFEELRTRQELQISQTNDQNRALDALKARVQATHGSIIDGQNELCYYHQKQKQLSHRILRCLSLQFLIQRYSVSVDEQEEKLESHLEAVNASILGPNQLKIYVRHLTQMFRDNREALKNSIPPNIAISKAYIDQLRRYLGRVQNALEKVVSIIESDKNDLEIVTRNIQ